MFHEKVKETRVRRNMTQKQLADAAQIAVGSVSAYENGGKLPPVDAAGRIAAALGVSLDWLLNDAPVEEAAQPAVGSVGDAARAFLALVQAGVLDHASHTHIFMKESQILECNDGLALRVTIDLDASEPMAKFIEGAYKMGHLVSDGTLDQDIYFTWRERELEKLDRIPLQKD